jgi:hypothetical protein
MPMPNATTVAVGEKKRRRRRADADGDPGDSLVLYFLGAVSQNDSEPIVLKERFPNEGGAMVESLKLEIKKEAVSARN